MDGDECATCGSADFHDEDGRIFCHNGHDQGRGLTTAEDDADFGRQGTIVRKKVDKEKQKASRVLRGAKAFQLFLQSWQFILWKQCHALVHQKGLPAELWNVVRDMWTLWVSRLEHRLLQDAATAVDGLTNTTGNEADTTASSGEESDTDPGASAQKMEKRKRESAHDYPKLIDTAALAYMGIIMLRRPVGQATFLRWILEEDIPFIRAIRHVPQEMKDRLPGEYHQSLDTTTRLPGPDDLQKAIYHRARWFNTSFGMAMPSINQNLFLLNYVRRLALPLEVYTTVRRLNTMITKHDFTYRYPDVTKPPETETTRRQPTTYPEAQLMSLVVVATKLLFPFDSDTVKRYPKDATDFTTLRMNWAAWLEAKERFDEDITAARVTNGLKPGSEILVTDSDILGMTDDQLDQYMSWYQRTWIKNSGSPQHTQGQDGGSGSGSMDREILDMFPLPDVPERMESREQNERLYAEEDARLTDRIKKVQNSLGSRRAISEEDELEQGLDIMRPGARYPQFAKVEDLDRAAGKDDVARTFHEETAQTACLSLKALILAVNRTEEKIERWLVARRREEIFGDEGSESDERGAGAEDGGIDEDIADVPETSPPGKLAQELNGLGLGLSPHVEDDDEYADMQMLPE
ncbi:hypothetical protein A1O7_09449 [Cladophialophora yegresii CBS 114405]|uniref:RRN7-type domain-containing protein n=1 Tax=Cladophialophora yegresii CBS 114405 TaxID=1182544 RepID=W9VER2_9EURO|nr:uncharacterized protein A1O7_09449 [Cladophialophora yegresii CBS 114405]EXJ54112.1 hypothetical protein A1O7_09449 [Cladophialophora yegresii CBS 114405]